MNDWIERINKLDLSLYNSILSSTSTGCKRSLLAVQRVTAKKHKKYAYLEIGSHLGGTIQPHLVDDRCRRIYSIDPRPKTQDLLKYWTIDRLGILRIMATTLQKECSPCLVAWATVT